MAKKKLRTLTIDIGGTGIKMLRVGADGEALGERHRELTPRPALPDAVIRVIAEMLKQHQDYDRVSVGFPGVVAHGIVATAPNLDDKAWAGVDLRAKIAELTQKPVRVINDADLQGYGVIQRNGVELVLTLGTGLGSALYSDGHLVPNLELGHHPFGNGKTYEQRVADKVRKKIGNKRFCKRVHEIIAQIEPILNYDRLYIGGGNAKRLDASKLPANVSVFSNVEGMEGGVRLWKDPLGNKL